MSARATRAFWSWFEAHLDELESVLTNTSPMSASLSDAMTAHVHAIHPEMNWEIGPEAAPNEHFFAFSPSGKPELLAISKSAVAFAPELRHWTFRPAKPPKNWEKRVVVLPLDGERRRVSYDGWHFVARAQPDAVIEIVFYSDELTDLSQGARQTLGWILLDSELGEEFTSSHRIVMDVEPCPEGMVARPIGELRAFAERIE